MKIIFLIIFILALFSCKKPVNTLISTGIKGYIDPILSGPTRGCNENNKEEGIDQVSELKRINTNVLCANCALVTMTGHRGGGDPEFCPYPENSILALRAFSICGNNEKKKYLEFDINSTKDGKLIVYHGPQLKKMVSFEENISVFQKIGIVSLKQFNKLTVNDLNYSFIKNLKLKGVGEQGIPLLDDYLDSSLRFGLHLKLVPDVKYVAPHLFKTLSQKLKSFGVRNKISVKPNITSYRWRELGSEGRKQMCLYMAVKKCRVNFF